MARKLQSAETNGLEVFAVRTGYIGLRPAPHDSSRESSGLGQERFRRHISHLIRGRVYP